MFDITVKTLFVNDLNFLFKIKILIFLNYFDM
jgi:hypothetical protein